MEKIDEITETTFNYLHSKLKMLGLDSDRKSFDEIRYILDNNVHLSPEEFAFECFYVVCVAGFRQDVAKNICNEIINVISNNNDFSIDDLLQIYKNRGKIIAIKDIWDNRIKYSNTFYNFNTIDEKVDFLGTLPFIGNITKYHLARNLGLDFVKYDIWIQRLGVALYGSNELINFIDNSKLNCDVKKACDIMFNEIKNKTGEKVGFIDVVLWRSCQKGLIKIDGKNVFIDKKF